MIARKRLQLLLLLVVSTLSLRCIAEDEIPEPKPARSIAELQQQIETILSDTHTPGASVAIVHHAGPEWVAGLGKADATTGRALTPETLVRIGQTSSIFVSIAILKLVDEGRLSLDTPVHDLIPEIWFENRWEATSPVRVVNLLEHTTGWDGLHLKDYAKDGRGMSLRDGLEFARASRVSRWPPGTRLAMCDSGPAVAAYIVEKLTGQRFEDYARQNLFFPIGLKSATYFQPAPQDTATPYRRDGKTPYPTRNFILRPARALNASALDMAALLMFYLNRGAVGDVRLIKAADVDRMETPASDWADKAGLKCGYGLGNECTQHEGFVYYGHGGQVEGGFANLSYLPEYDVGFFYSINSDNGVAFEKIGRAIREYVTLRLARPAVPPPTPLPADAAGCAGWYVPNSPQLEATRFLDEVFLLTRIQFRDGKMIIADMKESGSFLPAGGEQFRFAPKMSLPEPEATAVLLGQKEGTTFIQGGTIYTLKRLPTWLVAVQIVLSGILALAMTSIFLFALFSIAAGLFGRGLRPAERALQLWPLIAMLSLLAFLAIFHACREDMIERLGNFTIWSAGVWLTSVLFAVASLASVWTSWRARAQEVRRGVRVYSLIVASSLLVTTAFLAYWHVIGLRTWA